MGDEKILAWMASHCVPCTPQNTPGYSNREGVGHLHHAR